MKPIFIPMTFVLGTLFGIMLKHFNNDNEPQIKQQPISIGEVSDLINRLKPFTQYPNDKSWYRSGITLIFYSNSIELKLKTKNENEYKSVGSTLDEVVTNFSVPSDAIKKSLECWKK